jgi:hypothetical protein
LDLLEGCDDAQAGADGLDDLLEMLEVMCPDSLDDGRLGVFDGRDPNFPVGHGR